MTIWFTADHHFGHAGAINQNTRPFADVSEMNRVMVDNWNAVVRPEDEVYHLGDFTWKIKGPELEKLFDRLNGTKHLVEGNHDYGSAAQSLAWETMTQLNEVAVDGQRIVLCHYPLHEWRGSHRGAIHLHGHVHGNSQGPAGSIDVGVDEWNFYPVSLPQILARLEERRRQTLHPDQPLGLPTEAQTEQTLRYVRRLLEIMVEENVRHHALVRTAMDTIAHVDPKTRRDLQFICENGVEWERELAFQKIGDAVKSVLEDIIEQRILQPGKDPD